MVCSPQLFKVVVPNQSFPAESSNQLVKLCIPWALTQSGLVDLGLAFRNLFSVKTPGDSDMVWHLVITVSPDISKTNLRFSIQITISCKLTRVKIYVIGVRYKYYAHAYTGIIITIRKHILI